MYKDLKENIDIMQRTMESIKNNQMEFPELKNTVSTEERSIRKDLTTDASENLLWHFHMPSLMIT